MGLFRRKAAPAQPHEGDEERSIDLGRAWSQVNAQFAPTTSGVSVTQETALRSMAVWACQRQLTSTITSLPVDVVRKSGAKRHVLEGASVPSVVRRPDPRLSRRAWTGQVVRSMLSAGNVYGDITKVSPDTGRPEAITIRDPATIQWIAGRPWDGKQFRELWPLGDLWHLPVSFLLRPGATEAMSPIAYAAESIGTGIAAERFGASFFANSGLPIVDVKIAGSKWPTQEQLQTLREGYEASTRGRGPWVHGDAVEVKEGPRVNPDDSQFIELMRFEVEQACRIFGVPPSLVFAAVSGTNVTYANVTQSDLHYLKHSVMAWLVDLEDALSEFIAGPQVVKYRVDAVLRMDAEARTRVGVMRLQSKQTTVNEQRAYDDLDPFDDPVYDEPGIPGDSPNVIGVADAAAAA